ncbi:MAG: hypothetical protein LBG21_01095 [Campylobacteraceae bacterium]|jgi:hypothetical protein|nr:hypothetical protein [Campylobacteraceae bacterium]
MKKMVLGLAILSLVVGFINADETKSREYYKSHQKEAIKKSNECVKAEKAARKQWNSNFTFSDECFNAYMENPEISDTYKMIRKNEKEFDKMEKDALGLPKFRREI